MRNSNNITSFTPVCKKNTLVIKHNPVYAIIDKFFNEQTPEVAIFIKHNNVRKMNSSNAYLIKIPQDTEVLNIFASSGYVLSARHLRIDETYQRNEHGLMPAHYTEVYVNVVGNLKIVLHAYFNSVGNHTHTTIKQIDLSTMIEQHLKTSVGMHQDIAKNLSTASVVLHRLLKHKNELYKAELTNAEALGEALGKLYGAVNTVIGLEAYRIKATEFCACIDKINALNEINIDIRGKFIAEQLVKISQLSRTNNVSNEILIEHTELVPPTIHHPVVTRQPQKSVNRTQDQNKMLDCVIRKTKEHINTIKKIQTPNIDVNALHNLIYTMQDASIELLCCSGTQNQQISSLHKQLIDSIGKAKNLVKNKIVALMNSGDAVGLAKVVECGRNYLNFTTCYEFVASLIYISGENKKDLVRVNKLIAVCDLLYAESDIFKNAASTVAHGLHNINNDMCVSILLEVYQNKNLPVFKKIIEYGAYINIGAYSINDKTYLPLMTMLTFLSLNDGNFEYVNVLLANNVAMLSGRDLTKTSSLNLLMSDTSPTNEYKEHMLSMYQLMCSSLYEYTALEILLQYDVAKISYALLEKLAAVSNLKSLALSLAGFVNSKHISTRCVPSILEHGIYFCETADEKEQFFGRSFSENNTSKLLYLISTAAGSMLENLDKSAQLLCKMFQKKCAKLENRHQIDLYLLEISNDCTAVVNDSKFANYKLIQQTACLLLLSLKPELNLDDSRKALRFFNNIKILNTIYSNGNIKANNLATNRMANFLGTSKFKDELSKSLNNLAVQQLIMDNDVIKNSKIDGLLLGIALAVQRNDYAKLTSIIADPLYQFININSPVPGGAGKTVLHYACLGQSYPCAKLLILLGASIECKDNVGQTALELPDLSDNIKNTLVKLYDIYQDILEESPEYIQIFAMQKHNKNEECLNRILPSIAEIEIKYGIQRAPISQIFTYKPNIGAHNIAIKLPAALPNPSTLMEQEIQALLKLR